MDTAPGLPGIGHRRRTARALLAFAVIPDVVLGLYHLTHRGEQSGITELGFGGLLVLALYLVFYAGRSREPTAKANGFRSAGLLIVGAMAVVFLSLSVYHLATGGWRSFIVELCLAGILGSVIYLTIHPSES